MVKQEFSIKKGQMKAKPFKYLYWMLFYANYSNLFFNVTLFHCQNSSRNIEEVLIKLTIQAHIFYQVAYFMLVYIYF